jgi:Sodium/hydrogen exchanger family
LDGYVGVYSFFSASFNLSIDQVLLGTVLGSVIGIYLDSYCYKTSAHFSKYSGVIFSYVMKVSHRKGYIDHESYVAQYLALVFFTMGAASTLGTDDLLAAFAAGLLSLRIYFFIARRLQ